jgi:predicted nucleic acid-binding protein
VAADALDAALGDAERALLDASTLIAFHTPPERVYSLAVHLLARVESEADPLRAYCSVVTAAEVLVRPTRQGSARFSYMHQFLNRFPNLTLLSADLTVAVQAATVRAATGLPLSDAFTVASGLLAGCEAVITNDERWKCRCEPLFRQVRWLYLGDYL